MLFKKFLKESNRKPNKIWVDEGIQFYNNFFKKCLKNFLKAGYHVIISKYKNIFAKGYTPNWPEEVLVIKKVKNTVPWTYVINDVNGEEIIGTFYERELQ